MILRGLTLYERVCLAHLASRFCVKMLTNFLVTVAVTASAVALWPMPRSLTTGRTPLKLSDDFAIRLDIPNPPDDVVSAVATAKAQLRNDAFQRLVVGRATADVASIAHASVLQSLSISLTDHAVVRSIAAEAIIPFESRSESYQLNIPHNGHQATLTANSTLGLCRGLTTFTQVWYSSSSGKYLLDAPIDIVDAPAFVRFNLD